MRRHVVVTAVVVGLGVAAAGCLGQSEPEAPPPGVAIRNADATDVRLTVEAGAASAAWMESYVIPKFVEEQKAKGVNMSVTFDGTGAADERYRAEVALDLGTGGGADIVDLDGLWVGEFADAGYLRPLADVVGPAVEEWDGWRRIPEAVQDIGRFHGRRYAVPNGTDGRVLYFNRTLFARAGLPTDWQPETWDEVVEAAETLRALPGVTPIQLNAGTAMGEATSMQGVLPLLVGTGAELHSDGRWQGNTGGISDVLAVYERIYGTGLGDPLLQKEATGRERSFRLFADNRIGILLESDHLWSEVLEPTLGVAKMADRDTAVGWARIPAFRKGGGVRGQDFVSVSGGGVRVVNPNSEFPSQAWELLRFMNSADALKAGLGGRARLTHRTDVNDEVLSGDPLLSFIAREVLPLTWYRPGLARYPQVSAALRQATEDVVAGRSVPVAAEAYQAAVVRAVGEDKVVTGPR